MEKLDCFRLAGPMFRAVLGVNSGCRQELGSIPNPHAGEESPQSSGSPSAPAEIPSVSLLEGQPDRHALGAHKTDQSVPGLVACSPLPSPSLTASRYTHDSSDPSSLEAVLGCCTAHATYQLLADYRYKSHQSDSVSWPNRSLVEWIVYGPCVDGSE